MIRSTLIKEVLNKHRIQFAGYCSQKMCLLFCKESDTLSFSIFYQNNRYAFRSFLTEIHSDAEWIEYLSTIETAYGDEFPDGVQLEYTNGELFCVSECLCNGSDEEFLKRASDTLSVFINTASRITILPQKFNEK